MRFPVYPILFVVIIALVVSCAPKQPDDTPPPDLIDQNKFALIMVDVQLIEGMRVHKLGPKRENSVDMVPLYEDVFQKHGITEEEFRRTFEYYTNHPDKMKEIYEQVVDSLTTMEVKVKREFQETEMQRRDSINKAVGQGVDSVRYPPPE